MMIAMSSSNIFFDSQWKCASADEFHDEINISPTGSNLSSVLESVTISSWNARFSVHPLIAVLISRNFLRTNLRASNANSKTPIKTGTSDDAASLLSEIYDEFEHRTGCDDLLWTVHSKSSHSSQSTQEKQIIEEYENLTFAHLLHKMYYEFIIDVD